LPASVALGCTHIVDQIGSSEVPAPVASSCTRLIGRVCVVALIAARLSGSSDSWQYSCRLQDQVVAFIAARLSGLSDSW
jgi:hypothetical protein